MGTAKDSLKRVGDVQQNGTPQKPFIAYADANPPVQTRIGGKVTLKR